MDLASTISLVRLAQDGDQVALERLFARYYDRVRRIVRARLGGELRLEVESTDILQETFIAAIESFDRFELREEAGVISWLAAIAENRIRVHLRRIHAAKRDRRRQTALQSLRDSVTSGALQLEPAASITMPGSALVREEDHLRLEEALTSLKKEYRDVILERDYAGGSWDSVAGRIASPSADAARMLHARAIVELSAMMVD
jgi:RNA polymerase sigma-70 factor, ECF subfamily